MSGFFLKSSLLVFWDKLINWAWILLIHLYSQQTPAFTTWAPPSSFYVGAGDETQVPCLHAKYFTHVNP